MRLHFASLTRPLGLNSLYNKSETQILAEGTGTFFPDDLSSSLWRGARFLLLVLVRGGLGRQTLPMLMIMSVGPFHGCGLGIECTKAFTQMFRIVAEVL